MRTYKNLEIKTLKVNRIFRVKRAILNKKFDMYFLRKKAISAITPKRVVLLNA